MDLLLPHFGLIVWTLLSFLIVFLILKKFAWPMILNGLSEREANIANSIAAEHLEISAENPRKWAELIRHAGAIFMGPYTSESLGDYCAGPNHVLPTMRTSRFSSPLGVYDFIKRSSMIEVSDQGAQHLGKIASTLAHGEGLQAHARAAELRLKK